MSRLGFTLVEVIVSATILMLTVGCLLFVFSTGKFVVIRTGREVGAIGFARQSLERLKNEVREDTWNTGGLRIHVTGWQGLPGDFGSTFSGRRRYAVTEGPVADTSYREVTVTVDWNEPLESQLHP